MNRKGLVSSVDNIKHIARVTFNENDQSVSPELPIATHLGNLSVNDQVAVIFFNGVSDGLIIAKF